MNSFDVSTICVATSHTLPIGTLPSAAPSGSAEPSTTAPPISAMPAITSSARRLRCASDSVDRRGARGPRGPRGPRGAATAAAGARSSRSACRSASASATRAAVGRCEGSGSSIASITASASGLGRRWRRSRGMRSLPPCMSRATAARNESLCWPSASTTAVMVRARAKTSEAGVGWPPSSTSGATKCTVPRTSSSVGAVCSSIRAMPKSPRRAVPSGASSTFDGFTSQWTIPLRWAAARADATCTAASSTTSICESGAPTASSSTSRSPRVPPGTNSVTRNGMPSSVVPASIRLSTLPCHDSPASALTSSTGGSPGARRSFMRSLMATQRPVEHWRAR